MNCQHCGQLAIELVEHELVCNENPENRTCFSCTFFLKIAASMLYYSDLYSIDCPISQEVKNLGTFFGFVKHCTQYKPVGEDEKV